MAGSLARDLGQAGFAIVSGLARGIDSAGHRASLGTGTIAVLAGGHDKPYPPEHAELLDQIVANGATVSEMPLGHEPRPRDFPRRSPAPALIDDLVREANAPPGAVQIVLFELELAGRLERHGNGLVSLL